MPYVKQERRSALDKVVKALSESNSICDKAGIVDSMKFSSTLMHITDIILDKEHNKDEITKYITDSGLKINGDLNYILFKFCKYNVKPSYNNYKMFNAGLEYTIIGLYHDYRYEMTAKVLNLCGELNECVSEIRRRILGLYEDVKIIENGDV